MSDAGTAGPPRRALALRKRVRRIGLVRVVATLFFLIAALAVARYSWSIPLGAQAERGYYDFRTSHTAPVAPQDNRIVMIVFNDDTLINTRKRSPLDRATLARALANIDKMGARAIGIDILIDQPQDEDPELIAAFKGMKTPTYLAYADTATNADDIQYNQQQFLDEFQAAIAGPKVKRASIRLEVDSDNVARSWPAQPRALPPLLASALVPQSAEAKRYTGSIRWRLPPAIDRPLFTSLPIDLFAGEEIVPAFADQVRGKYVLIGGDIIDSDEYQTPLRGFYGGSIIGLEVHAQILAQTLDDIWPRTLPGWVQWLIAAAVVLAGALSSLVGGVLWRTVLLLVLQFATMGYLPYFLQSRGIDTQQLPAFGWLVGWVIAFAASGAAARAVGSEQRKFAQSALGKYLPRDIAAQILADPERLALHGEKREIFVVFTDLEGFTKLSHAIEPEMVALLLNRYLDMLSDVVLEYGGTIDKFVGDAVVSFWGAPISRPDDGERAARAAYAMWQAGEEFRATVPEGVPPIGKTRVGLHFGEAIVGNFGGEGRIQYTALGDSMNTAARLESANKQLGSNVMVSREAMERSGLDWWRPMGRISLRGRARAVDIFEPVPNLSKSDLGHFADIMAGVDRGQKESIDALAGLARAHPEDEALANLVRRVQHMEVGGSYVLD